MVHLLLLALLSSQPMTAAATPAFLSVRLDERSWPNMRVLRLGSDVLAGVDDVEEWGLLVPAPAVVETAGGRWVSLAALEHLRFRVDELRQELLLTAEPAAYKLHRLATRLAPAPQPSAPSAFLDYDATAVFGAGGRRLAGRFELGLARDAWNVSSTAVATAEGVHRLATTWTLDRPERPASWRVGDAVTYSGALGLPLRFAGVQWATDFRIRPEFVTYPLPVLAGEAALPSALDLYVDGALRWHGEVAAGPFRIDDPPLLDGAGNVELRIRDLSGRERSLRQPAYVSSTLLRRGLAEHGYQAGWVRRGYGGGEDRYGELLVSGTYRRGLSDALTGELHGGLLDGLGNLGAAATWKAGRLGMVSGSLLASRGRAGDGLQATLGLERRARAASWSAEILETAGDFAMLGAYPARMVRRQRRVRWSTAAQARGSFSLAYLDRLRGDGSRVELLSATYSRRLVSGLRLGLTASGSRDSRLDGGSDPRLAFTLTWSPGGRATVSGRLRSTRDGGERTAQVFRGLSRGESVGYRVAATDGRRQRLEAGLTVQREVGTFGLELRDDGERTAGRLSARGGVAYVGGVVAPTRSVTSGFALVRVGGVPGVRIYGDHQLVARTDRRGRALVPGLRAFRDNRLRLAAEDLPLTARFDALELHAVPYARGGLLLDFPVRVEPGFLVRVVLAGGAPPAAGSTAILASTGEELFVGYRGEIYVTGAAPRDHLVLRTATGRCTVALDLEELPATQATVGPLDCLPPR